MTCVILLNGEYEDDAYYLRQIEAARVVVAVDGGHRILRRLERWPQVLIGDFDSLDAGLLVEAREAGVETIGYPARKDETDAELAVEWVFSRYPDDVVFLGGFGGALDHVMGHICVLRGLATRGRAARIASPDLTATVLWAPLRLRLGAPPGTRASLVALSPTAVLTLRGFDYELTNAPLSAASCRGLSNGVAVAGASIGLVSGLLLAMVYDGRETFAREPATA
jgi:thiamine pyrophosphokinase